MAFLGFIVMVIGAVGLLLTITGFSILIPQIDSVSSNVWGGLFIAGALTFFITRRARD